MVPGRPRVLLAGELRSRRWLPTFGLIAIQPQKLLIQFADRFDGFLEVAEMLDGFTNLRDLCRAEAKLRCLAAGVTDVENPKGAALAASAFRAASGMMDGTFEQGAAENIADRRDAGGELGLVCG